MSFRSSHQRPATLLKKRLWHRCFPVNFAKFLRTRFLQNTSGRLLLDFILKKQQFKSLAVFSSIFVNNTKIIADYNFVAPLRSGREIEWILSKYLNILRKSEIFFSRNVVFIKVEIHRDTEIFNIYKYF